MSQYNTADLRSGQTLASYFAETRLFNFFSHLHIFLGRDATGVVGRRVQSSASVVADVHVGVVICCLRRSRQCGPTRLRSPAGKSFVSDRSNDGASSPKCQSGNSLRLACSSASFSFRRMWISPRCQMSAPGPSLPAEATSVWLLCPSRPFARQPNPGFRCLAAAAQSASDSGGTFSVIQDPAAMYAPVAQPSAAPQASHPILRRRRRRSSSVCL